MNFEILNKAIIDNFGICISYEDLINNSWHLEDNGLILQSCNYHSDEFWCGYFSIKKMFDSQGITEIHTQLFANTHINPGYFKMLLKSSTKEIWSPIIKIEDYDKFLSLKCYL